MANLPIASGLLLSPHITALDDMVRERFLDVEPYWIMVYLADLVPADALPALAEQLDVLGFKGWNLTSTEDEQRELIKNAIALHKTKGTIGAMKNAFAAFGYPGITIIEGREEPLYDGIWYHDGTIDYGSGLINWAVFSVILDIGDSKGLKTSDIPLVKNIIDEYKPMRCRLERLSFVASLVETVTVKDEGLVLIIV